MSCRRRCAAKMLLGFLRLYPRGVRICVHGRSWRMRTYEDRVEIERWSRWLQVWVPVGVVPVEDEPQT